MIWLIILFYSNLSFGQDYEGLSRARSRHDLVQSLRRSDTRRIQAIACKLQLQSKQIPWACYAARLKVNNLDSICYRRAQAIENQSDLPRLENQRALSAKCMAALKERESILIYKEN